MPDKSKDDWEELRQYSGQIRAEHIKSMRENELAQARALRDRINKNLNAMPSADEEPLNDEVEKPVDTKSDSAESEKGELPVYEDDTSTENSLKTVALRRELIYLKNQQQNLELRKYIANIAVWAVGIQMFLTNVTFVGYMNAVDYRPESEVMISWMASTVVQIVGIAMVVTRNLFPSRNGNSKKDEESDV